MSSTAPDGGSAVGIWGPEFDDGSEVCTGCGERMDAPSVEFFEETGDLRCADCEAAFWEAQDDWEADA